MAVRTLIEVTPGYGFRFGVDVTGDDAAVFGQTLGHHQRAVAGEHSYLQYSPGADEPHQHLQKLTLYPAHLHHRAGHISIGFFTQAAKEIRFRFGMIVSVFLDILIYEFKHDSSSTKRLAYNNHY